MRVALVSEHASPLADLGGVDAGGQNVYVGALAAELARRGADVTVFTRRDHPDLPQVVRIGDVRVHHVDAGPAEFLPKDELLAHMGQFGEGLRRAWRKRPPHVVHAHFWMSGLAAAAALDGLAIPLVQTFHALGVVKRRHQGSDDPSPAVREEIEAGLLGRADHTIATCSDEVFELVRMGGDPRAISVVPCGVDLHRFRPDGHTEPRSAGHGRIVVVSRLVARKGVGNAVTALAGVPGAELVIAGGPAAGRLDQDVEARRLRDLACAAGVEDRVELRGQVARDDLPALLRSADAVACVPWYEPFGIVPLEAMACGVPVVATAVGGLVDTVVDGVVGLHVPPRRPDLLSVALRRLLSDASLRRCFGAAGLRRARSRYGWPRVADGVLGVYHDVLSHTAPAREQPG